MTVGELLKKTQFEVINEGDTEKQISKVFCCDLLSIAMAKNPQGSVWVTVMGNVNTIAVNVLTDGACIIFAEGINPDEVALKKAKSENVTLLKTDLPVFDAGMIVNNIIN